MSIGNWLSIGQLTFVLFITWCAARLWLSRQPQIAAKVCLVGLALSTTLAILMAFAVPRPLIFQADSLHGLTAVYSAEEPDDVVSIADDSMPQPANELADSAQNSMAELSWQGLSWQGIRFGGKQAFDALESLSNQSQNYSSSLQAIGAVIVIGVVIQAILVGFGTWELWRLNRASKDVTCTRTAEKLNKLCEKAGVAKPPRLRVHGLSLGAFVSWTDPSVIYLPSHYTVWTAEELNAALAHELMHVVRHDGWWRYVSRVCAGMLWFHPAAWILHRELCLAQELNADRTARTLVPGSDYLVGLARLGLRLDSDSQGRMPNLSVSVFSKDLIMRIEMLKRSQGATSWASQRLAQGTLGAVLVVCATNFCWTVVADESIRIANRIVEGSTQSKHVAFQKTKLEPWQVVPASPGYAAIRASSVSDNEYLQSLIAMAEEYVASRLLTPVFHAAEKETMFAKGLRLRNLATVQMSVNMSQSTRISAADGDKDAAVTKEEQHFSIGANQVVIDTIVPIDWQAIVELFPAERLTAILNSAAGPWERAQSQELLDRLASLPSDQCRYSFHTEPNCGDAVDSTLASVWRAVDGGLATFAVDYQASIRSDQGSSEQPESGFLSMVSSSTRESTDAPMANANNVAELEQSKLMTMIGYIGIGIDHTAMPPELQYRALCTPIDGVTIDELESQWKRFSAAAIEVLETDEAEDDANTKQLVNQLRSMQCKRTGLDDDRRPAGIILSGAVQLP